MYALEISEKVSLLHFNLKSYIILLIKYLKLLKAFSLLHVCPFSLRIKNFYEIFKTFVSDLCI